MIRVKVDGVMSAPPNKVDTCATALRTTKRVVYTAGRRPLRLLGRFLSVGAQRGVYPAESGPSLLLTIEALTEQSRSSADSWSLDPALERKQRAWPI
jgi:hypothetical protein